MKQAMSQETVNDSSHSRIPKENESNTQGSTLKSAAMLGIALSVGASGALVSQAEASAAVSVSNTSAATKAFSSDSKTSDTKVSEESQISQQQIVDYHTVESGESLWQIAQQHGIGLRDLKSANALPPETSIRVGQVLRVPGSDGADVVVASSDAAQVIARLALEDQTTEALQTDTLSTADVELNQQSTDEPVVLAQASEEEVDSFEAASVESIAAPVASIEIEIADASSDEEVSEPVVTALAPSDSFSNYRIQAGDTLGSIASSLGITPEALIRSNALTNPDVILVGATLRVPADSSASTSLASKTDISVNDAARLRQFGSSSDQLAYLRSTAARPDSARILDELRTASPEEALSVGGEEITEQDILSTEAQSVDPYVANLMQEVQQIRSQSVQVSEAATSEIESDSTLLARGADSPSLLSRRAARVSEAPAAEASSDLLAAAPLSPDAYIPAQRSSAGQVVSPDMPILPSADEYLPETPNHFDGYIWPTQGTVTSGYGWRWGRMHRGVDVAGPVGTPIVAAAPGIVEQAGWNSGGFGNLVEIRHPDGSMTRYAHNNTVSVSAGQQVRQGQQIAEMGSTGYSTGPHLHFEVHQADGAVNPVAYLPNR